MKEPLEGRRGVSLVELLVVMSLSSMLLTTSAVVLHRMMHSHGKTRHFLDASRSALRLAAQFRSDVHRAQEVTTDNLPPDIVLRLQLGESDVVQYSHVGGLVRRTQLVREEVISREEYAFPAGSQLAIREQMSPRLLSLSIKSMPGDAGGPVQHGFATAVHLQIDAQPGRDSRYTDVASEARP
jgi:prepilin-type N-terminal cleavage/methylation domain-containing protein